jgi:hypothetical protein
MSPYSVQPSADTLERVFAGSFRAGQYRVDFQAVQQHLELTRRSRDSQHGNVIRTLAVTLSA